MDKVEFKNGDHTDCWLWTANKNHNGYGRFSVGSRTNGTMRSVSAHRWAYETWSGPLVPGLEIDHLCTTPACVNPRHLEQVTQLENIRRSHRAEVTGGGLVNKQKTECKHGHPFDDANTYRYTSEGRIYRGCITCRTRTMKAWADKKGLQPSQRH